MVGPRLALRKPGGDGVHLLGVHHTQEWDQRLPVRGVSRGTVPQEKDQKKLTLIIFNLSSSQGFFRGYSFTFYFLMFFFSVSLSDFSLSGESFHPKTYPNLILDVSFKDSREISVNLK